MASLGAGYGAYRKLSRAAATGAAKNPFFLSPSR